MCCDSWGRKESDTTERLNLTELYSTGNSTNSVATYVGTESKKELIHVYV